jgi:hypothetical protein
MVYTPFFDGLHTSHSESHNENNLFKEAAARQVGA